MLMKDPATGDPGIVLGMQISVFNERRTDGTYGFQGGDSNYWMPGKQVELTLVPIKGGRLSIEPESRAFSIVNEFQSGVFEIDKNRVLISLADAQGKWLARESAATHGHVAARFHLVCETRVWMVLRAK